MNSSREGVRRRDFLVLGSAGLAALCFGGSVQAQALATAKTAPLPMPIGFLAGSEEAASLRKLPPRIRRPRMASADGSEHVIVPADSLPMGDTQLIGAPLRLTVHGLYPPGGISPNKWAELPLAIDLDVLFPSPDPMFPEPIRFYAWSFRRQPGWNASPPVSFVFPLDWEAMPELSLRVVSPNGEERTYRARFTFDDEAGQPRLLRGAYVLGTTPKVWRSNVALRALGPDTPASYASVLLSVESEPSE